MKVFRRFLSTVTTRNVPSKARHHRPLASTTLPTGYLLTGVHAGVKKAEGVLDLGIILSTSSRPSSAAACFTRNAFKAAPVIVSQDVLERSGGRVRAVVVNSGCANALTGQQGLDDAWAMVKATNSLLPAPSSQDETLVMSTGVIGGTLPISKVLAAIGSQHSDDPRRSLDSDFYAWERTAKAFMTTDTFPKLRSRVFTINGVQYRMAGMEKGAGMIHPNMGPPAATKDQLHATLLGCIMTDAAVSPQSLQNALTYAVDRSFNSISVDGDMSTNDTILVLANGAAASDGSGNYADEIDEHRDPSAYNQFKEELTAFAVDLAKLIARDGEGATKFITVNVKHAATYQDARSIASQISTSPLVKTALYGEDANWGRILAAAGSVSLTVPLDSATVSVSFIPSDGSAALPVLVNGEPEAMDEERASEVLGLEDFEVCVDLGALGTEEATYWTCDFSYEYVRINGDYRS